MWTRSARKPEGFLVEVNDWNGKMVHSAWYQTVAEAQEAGQHWERLVTLGLVDGEPVMTLDEIMSDDDLLAELLG